MAIKKTKKTSSVTKKNKSLLNFKEAVTSLSLLGTLWRTAIAAALFLSVYSLNELLELERAASGNTSTLVTTLSNSAVMSSVLQTLVIFSGTVFVLDALYVSFANRYPLSVRFDKVFLISLELGFAAVILIDWAILRSQLISNEIYGRSITETLLFSLIALVVVAVPLRAFIGITQDVAMKRR